MNETITLNLINKTEHIAAANVVICQHNAAAGMRCNPVAWRVLQDVTADAPQSFEVPRAFEVAVQDGSAQATAPAPFVAGQSYEAVSGDAGVVLRDAQGDVQTSENMSVTNQLEEDVVSVTAHKSGRLVAIRTDIAPGDMAAFRFIDHVYVGLAGRVAEGELISDAVASRITARINLFGVRRADIVMTTKDKDTRAPVFRLENIQC